MDRKGLGDFEAVPCTIGMMNDEESWKRQDRRRKNKESAEEVCRSDNGRLNGPAHEKSKNSG